MRCCVQEGEETVSISALLRRANAELAKPQAAAPTAMDGEVQKTQEQLFCRNSMCNCAPGAMPSRRARNNLHPAPGRNNSPLYSSSLAGRVTVARQRQPSGGHGMARTARGLRCAGCGEYASCLRRGTRDLAAHGGERVFQRRLRPRRCRYSACWKPAASTSTASGSWVWMMKAGHPARAPIRSCHSNCNARAVCTCLGERELEFGPRPPDANGSRGLGRQRGIQPSAE